MRPGRGRETMMGRGQISRVSFRNLRRLPQRRGPRWPQFFLFNLPHGRSLSHPFVSPTAARHPSPPPPIHICMQVVALGRQNCTDLIRLTRCVAIDDDGTIPVHTSKSFYRGSCSVRNRSNPIFSIKAHHHTVHTGRQVPKGSNCHPGATRYKHTRHTRYQVYVLYLQHHDDSAGRANVCNICSTSITTELMSRWRHVCQCLRAVESSPTTTSSRREVFVRTG